MKKIEIDGNRFSNLSQFYDEVERKMTNGLDWEIGRNMNAFNDVLYGGFGVHDYEEAFELIWLNAEKSRIDLGKDATIKYIQEKLNNCHPSNKEEVKNDLALAQQGIGETLFEIIVAIIREHTQVKLTL